MCLIVLFQYMISHPTPSTTSIGSAQSWGALLWDCRIEGRHLCWAGGGICTVWSCRHGRGCGFGKCRPLHLAPQGLLPDFQGAGVWSWGSSHMVRGFSTALLAEDVVGTFLSCCRHGQLLVLSSFVASSLSSLFGFFFFFLP